LRDYYFTFAANSGLTPESQVRVQEQVASQLRESGVRNVRTFAGKRPLLAWFLKGARSIEVTGDRRVVGTGDETFGGRDSIMKSVEVSTAKAQGLTQDGKVNFVSNIALHEIGHNAGLNPFDGVWGPDGPSGTIMEQVEPATEENAEIVGAEARDYSEEDAAKVAEEEDDGPAPPL